MAGIYAVGPQPGGVFDHNVVWNVSCGGNGAHALYIDQACSGTRWTNNVAFAVASAVLHVNYGLDNTVTNNVLVGGDYVPLPGVPPCSYPAGSLQGCAGRGGQQGCPAQQGYPLPRAAPDADPHGAPLQGTGPQAALVETPPATATHTGDVAAAADAPWAP